MWAQNMHILKESCADSTGPCAHTTHVSWTLHVSSAQSLVSLKVTLWSPALYSFDEVSFLRNPKVHSLHLCLCCTCFVDDLCVRSLDEDDCHFPAVFPPTLQLWPANTLLHAVSLFMGHVGPIMTQMLQTALKTWTGPSLWVPSYQVWGSAFCTFLHDNTVSPPGACMSTLLLPCRLAGLWPFVVAVHLRWKQKSKKRRVCESRGSVRAELVSNHSRT